MSTYVYLPPIPVTAAADTTGLNSGNWTAVVSTANLGISYLNQYESFKQTIDGPVGFGVSIFIDNKKWSHTAQGWQNEWDANQPMPVKSGQTIYWFWAAPTTTTPIPTVTMWFRYDADLIGRDI